MCWHVLYLLNDNLWLENIFITGQTGLLNSCVIPYKIDGHGYQNKHAIARFLIFPPGSECKGHTWAGDELLCLLTQPVITF